MDPDPPIVDFIDFPLAPHVDVGDDVSSLFMCGMTCADGRSSVTVTVEAVYLHDNDAVTRVDVLDIRSWATVEQGPLFTLTVEGTGLHAVRLPAEFHDATVDALSRAVEIWNGARVSSEQKRTCLSSGETT